MVSPRVGPGPLAVLCGPTATGKSAIAVPLAERLGAEIVAADSRTVYRGMDIGTAKPPPALRVRVPHHLIDVADPREIVTAAEFQRLARAAIDGIRRRGRLPLIVGGTGFYIRAVTDGCAFPPVPPDRDLRARLEAEARTYGPVALHARLAALDPASAAAIHPHNIRRVVRALEIALHTGAPRPLVAPGDGAPVVMVGLVMERAALYRRIAARVHAQLAAGLVDETRRLLAEGVPLDRPSMQGLGYKEIASWLRGERGYDEAVRVLIRNTRQYAKRQLTWFRREPRLHWVDVTGAATDEVVARVHGIMDRELRAMKEA
ncbi:MAG: tRNA (adenosine(37)-N6)-dimethylallyltransferase MiaA [Armatimonadota bacterium]|nr:tRNA (adenosine(37)-N6)-dimethylallyltransferase MiaA [Armatimonadota bacterium]